MFVEELVLDGFKSYATRTVISDWDPEFNAITGLNGSGKSNILDSICFVLGISNLSQVRASNLQDLVYKRGQAGVTKASVTIVFDNSDKKQSPIGFEQCDKITVTRQIVIGGKNKYLINGHAAQQQNVANLFQSVQLNINNPHFLIMQGRITKVLNMKPPEVLAMIEEAAGTRMFEEKKDKALKTIAKKDQKLQEITDLMEKDIAPKLDRLKKEKADFMNFQKIEGELERLRRFITAYDFSIFNGKLEQSATELERKQEIIKELEVTVKQLHDELGDIESLLKSLNAKKEKEMKKSGKYNDLQAQVNAIANTLTRLNTQYELKTGAIDEELANLKSLSGTIETLTSALSKTQKASDKKEKEYNATKEAHKAEADRVEKQEEFLQTLATGISANEGNGNGFAEQLEAANSEKTEANTAAEKAKQRIAFLKDQIKSKQSQVKEAEKENAELSKQFKSMQTEIEQLKVQRMEIEYDPNMETEMKKRRAKKQQEMDKIQQEIDILSGQLSNLDFSFSDPYPKFDRSKVKGLVAKLIKIDPDNLQYTTALQVCAEGRLFFVVVEDNQVASDLLKGGKLKRKYTIIPLQQIVAHNLGEDRINRARSLAPGKVEHALCLVGYDEEVEAAMKFVFGSTFICQDAESAKAVAYDPKVRARAITIDGDVYEPGATITGGSSSSSNDVLLRLTKLSQLEDERQLILQQLEEIDDKLQKYSSLGQRFKAIEQDLHRKEYEFNSLEKLLQSSPAGQLIHEFERMKAETVELEDEIKRCKQCQTAAEQLVKEIQKEMAEFSTNKDGKLKKLEKELVKSKADLSKKNETIKAEHELVIGLREELEQLKADLAEAQQNVESSKQSIAKIEEEKQDLEGRIREDKTKYDELNGQLQKFSRMFAQFDSELNSLEAEKKQKNNAYHEQTLEIKKLVHEVERFDQEKDQAEQAVRHMLKENPWIAEQQQNFGRPNSAFDFNAQNPSECRKRLKQLEQEHESLRKKINVKVMNMIDRVLTKERSLKQMLATVNRDKDKIQETIDQLDQYKRDALRRTWTKVNADFGAIFNDLLQGNTAKLEPPEGQSITEGLEVKVCLGGVWKQSLTELSGGQRSLVALSLILSLLQFKPAPMYILDEIDAALDLSHTQNIGHLFRTRFKGSQFIVVSLKEGMFNNANVLFKARFRDGTSVVERFTQRQSSSTAIAEPLKGRNASNSTLSDKENALATNSGASKRSRRV